MHGRWKTSPGPSPGVGRGTSIRAAATFTLSLLLALAIDWAVAAIAISFASARFWVPVIAGGVLLAVFLLRSRPTRAIGGWMLVWGTLGLLVELFLFFGVSHS